MVTVGARDDIALSTHPPTLGLLAQVGVLAALAAAVGLGAAGWLAGTAYAVGTWVLLSRSWQPSHQWGHANTVTLTRATLVGAVAALVADSFTGRAPGAALVILAAVALSLDAVDGQVARRTRCVSRLGARFDMEIDSVLVLVLSAYLVPALGWWVLAAGLPRYLFAAAGWVLPWLRGSLPPRYSRKVVAATQGIVLVVVSAGFLPAPLSAAAVGVVLVLLGGAFGRDVRWLWRARPRPVAASEPPSDGDSPPDGKSPRPWRRVAARVATVLAGLLVLFALLAPDQLSHLTLGGFVRLPVGALVAAGLLLVVPGRVKPVVAAVAGAVLGLLTIGKLVNMGFYVFLSRPFDPVFDWSFLGPGLVFVEESNGPAAAIGLAVGAVALAAAVLVLVTLSVRRLARLVDAHRTGVARTLTVLGAAWLACALLGAQVVAGQPVATAPAYDRARQVYTSLRDREAFATESAVDAFGDTPASELLTALRGKDVILAFVESYGRDAIEDPNLAPEVDAVLDAGGARLRAAGFGSRSAFVTSPVAGGGSWLAQASLLSGLWISNQQRYRTLLDSDRLTLNGAFARAGWRSVALMPGLTREWPEGEFFGYDRIYDRYEIGYEGPRINWADVPDQFLLSAFHRLERAPADRDPVMAVIPLVSSHLPWTPVPRLLDWDRIGDGSIYQTLPAARTEPDPLWREPDKARTYYPHAIAYSLGSLISYLETYGDEDLVTIFLGDHQPGSFVTGDNAGHDAPITIVARDPAVLERISGWAWEPGLNPGPDAPVWRMDTFRDQFLTAFGPPTPATAAAPG